MTGEGQVKGLICLIGQVQNGSLHYQSVQSQSSWHTGVLDQHILLAVSALI